MSVFSLTHQRSNYIHVGIYGTEQENVVIVYIHPPQIAI